MKIGGRQLLFMLGMLGLLGAAYFLVFTKANAKRALRTTEVENKEKALIELDRATSGISDVSRKIDELQKAITFFESKLPQEREIDKILQELWQLAEANSLQTKTIKTLKNQRTAHYSEQPIDMTLSGNFYGYYAFLQQLEKLPRLTRVTQMNLKKISDHEGEMEAQMTLSIFFEPESTESASAR